MDHDRTLFISHFHISEDGSYDFSVFIRVKCQEKRQEGRDGINSNPCQNKGTLHV